VSVIGSAGPQREAHQLLKDYRDARYVAITIMEPERWVLEIMFKSGFRATFDIKGACSSKNISSGINDFINMYRPSLSGKHDDTINGIASTIASALTGENPETLEWNSTLRQASFRLFLDIHARNPWGGVLEYEDILEQVRAHYSASDSS
jgi:hypothetical protein